MSRLLFPAWLVAAALVLAPPSQHAYADTLSFTLQSDSYIDLTVLINNIDPPGPPGDHSSTPARTDLSGQLTADLSGAGTSIDAVQLLTGNISGTNAVITVNFTIPFPALDASLNAAHYNVAGGVAQVDPSDQFDVAGTVVTIDSGVLTFPAPVFPYDFSAVPVPFPLNTASATITGSMAPGDTIDLLIPIEFDNLQMLQKGVANSNGDGYISGSGFVHAVATVPIPEPSSVTLVLMGLMGLIMPRRGRRR